MAKQSKVLSCLKDGMILQNPVFVQLIGMCPTMATTTSLKNGIGMGLAVTAVLIASNFLISLFRKFIPDKIRIAAFVVIIAGLVTIIDLLMQAYLPALSASLGLFIPLIVVNCIILARAEMFACKNSPFLSAVDGFASGIGFTLALCVLSTVREIIGNGSILGFSLFGKSFMPAMLIIMPAGGFLTLGVLMALFQYIKSRKEEQVK